MVRKFAWCKISLFVIMYVVIPITAMDLEKTLHQEIQNIIDKDIKSISIHLGNGLTHLLKTEEARLAYPGHNFMEPAARLIPFHINDQDDKRLFTNILLPYALVLADRCKIDTVLKYNNKTSEFDIAKINDPFEYRFSKTNSFLQEVADKVETEHIIALERIVVEYKRNQMTDPVFCADKSEKKFEELSMQITTLKNSRQFFMIGCAFLCVFIFFRCDWWNKREIFNF